MAMDEDFADFDKRWRDSLAHAAKEVDPRWSVTGYKAHRTRNGVAWVATLHLDGKAVGYLEDAGQGGSVRIDFWAKSANGDGVRYDDVTAKIWASEVARVLPDEGQFNGSEMLIEALLQKAGK